MAPLDLQYGGHCADKMYPLLSDSWRMFSLSEARRWKYRVKNPHGQWTTKYCSGVPRHVKNLQPVIWTQLSSSYESNSEDSEHLIYLNSNPFDSDSDASSLPTDEVSIETRTTDESTHEGEAYGIPLRRSTLQRRILPPCPVCDHEIKGECRENRNLPN